MLSYITANLWDFTKDHLIVVPINNQGVMGAGLALEAKRRYPKQCLNDIKVRKELYPNIQVQIRIDPPLIFFPTKHTWRENSDIELVKSSLFSLSLKLVKLSELFDRGVSIAMPRVGCGLGRLNWEKDVQPWVEAFLGGLTKNIQIKVVAQGR